MKDDRRQFLASAGAIGVASLVVPGRVFAQLAYDPGDLMRRADYAARVKEWFYLENADASHQSYLELIDVADYVENAKGVGKKSGKEFEKFSPISGGLSGDGDFPGWRMEQFSLTFRSASGDLPIPSGYYEVAGESFNVTVKHTHELGGRHYYRAEFALLF